MYRDIVFWDDVGTSISPLVAARTGMGGSEFEVMLIATELARLGKSVRVVNRLSSSDIAYEVFDSGGTVEFTNRCDSVEAGALVIHRYSSFPTFIRSAHKYFVLSTDVFDPSYNKFDPMLRNGSLTLICVSDIHASRYPTPWKKLALPYMLPKTSTLLNQVRDPDKYIFASSKIKGLHPTLEMWSRIKYPGARLHVFSPGYEPLTSAEVEIDSSISFRGSISTSDLMNEMQSSAGMVLVNTYPEMFGLAPVLAESLGCRMHVLYSDDAGALPEVLTSKLPTRSREEFIKRFESEREFPSPQPPPHDFSIERWIPEWEKILCSSD